MSVITTHGYVAVFLPKNPMASSNGYVYEHRLVMSRKLGRLLDSFEQVHHIDGNKKNNDPSNLELVTDSEHKLKHRTPGSNKKLPNEGNYAVECLCGCGKNFYRFDNFGRPRMYINGHNPIIKNPSRDTILNALLQGPKSTQELIELCGGRDIYYALSSLRKDRLVTHVSYGKWELFNG